MSVYVIFVNTVSAKFWELNTSDNMNFKTKTPQIDIWLDLWLELNSSSGSCYSESFSKFLSHFADNEYSDARALIHNNTAVMEIWWHIMPCCAMVSSTGWMEV